MVGRRTLTRSALLLAFAAALALTGCSTGPGAVDQSSGGANGYVAGDGKTVEYTTSHRTTAPDFGGATLAGGRFDLAAHRGDVIVVNFWASWCAPCRLESAQLQATYQALKSRGVEFIGVDSRDARDAALSFITGRVSYPSLFDPAGRIALKFKDVPTALPSTLIIDRQGRVAVVIRNTVTQRSLTPLVEKVAGEST